MTSTATFLQHKNNAHPEVIGVEYDLHFPELAQSVASELRQEGMLAQVDGTYVKATWGAES